MTEQLESAINCLRGAKKQNIADEHLIMIVLTWMMKLGGQVDNV